MTVLPSDPFLQACDLLVLPVTKGATPFAGAASSWRKKLDSKIIEYAEASGFEGNPGEWLVLPTYGLANATSVALLGVGPRASMNTDTFRRVGAITVRRARDIRAKVIVTSLDAMTVPTVSAREAGEAYAEGAGLAAYGFHAYHKKHAERHAKTLITSIAIAVESKQSAAAMERGIAEAGILVEATCLARDLVNTPSSDMHPARMAEIAQDVAATSKRISLKLLDKTRMEQLKMNAVLAVGSGSAHEPVGVHLTYKPQASAASAKRHAKTLKKIVIVGKAVTFDSGGLSLKTADGMATMKIDMAGAAAVLGLFKALPMIAPNVEVHGIFLAVENMPSGHAYRPGDVVRAMNGTTIEILNTDAEGRVTLADALSYASTLEPDAIIDLATLTGACVVALGDDIAGMMGTDRKLSDRLMLASKASGELLWELPMYPPYEEHVKSKIADIKNVGAKGQAGAIAGAMFLKHFVPPEIPWAHLDIAGPAYAERDLRSDIPAGGTGFGVRVLARYLQGL